ncbi:3'(2'),5'-bisphosphate nucleotidase CysQ [Oleiagrimonas soli]|uniref:3'(2'),5'-bisphosphate nucleotidase CysQ n=2 Tax=Oleiagrimonas soli TaxID=1543381 RepID=A0A841KIU1_9GAMM|nr:3'(2'),5'-bisphosphate nucleotidase CysQ [Oleiagrimonas soli]MBB6185533.1 3'(2'), 5'-bisphosphate nucleotidase [Oleiagrimonas soli]
MNDLLRDDMLTAAVIGIARRAGDAILEVYGRDFDVEQKADDSPLTAADLAAHRIIVDSLQALTPEIPVLSEESADIAWDVRRGWQRYWLVDPLDGTREFVKRNGEFTVNIALIEGDRSVLGVVQTPVTGDLYYARHGHGAFRQERPDDEPQRLRTRQADAPLTVAGSRSHGSERQRELLARLGEHELIARGSSLKFCLVARGDADLYLRAGLTSEWDTAAAQCVLEAAGGAVRTFDGEPLRYNRKDSLLNPEFIAVGDAGVDWAARLAS